MAASLPRLREIVKGRTEDASSRRWVSHPEVTDPRKFLEHQSRYFKFLEKKERGINEAQNLPEYLRESYSYTDTLGPRSTRDCFARVYGSDWGMNIDPDLLFQPSARRGLI